MPVDIVNQSTCSVVAGQPEVVRQCHNRMGTMWQSYFLKKNKALDINLTVGLQVLGNTATLSLELQ